MRSRSRAWAYQRLMPTSSGTALISARAGSNPWPIVARSSQRQTRPALPRAAARQLGPPALGRVEEGVVPLDEDLAGVVIVARGAVHGGEAGVALRGRRALPAEPVGLEAVGEQEVARDVGAVGVQAAARDAGQVDRAGAGLLEHDRLGPSWQRCRTRRRGSSAASRRRPPR